jgi:uncharacterized protein YutE (UPF0331/DUF86 family)
MFDLERISKIKSDVERYLKDLDEFGIESQSDLADKKNFYSLSMVLFAIINRIIDLGEEIVYGKGLGTPGSYKEIFSILARNKVIEKKMARELSNLVFHRNLLSHEYFNIMEEDVFEVFEKMGVVQEFLERIGEIVREEE